MKLCPRCNESYADDAGFCPIDGTELVKNTDPLVGRTLASRYRLVRRLGTGGMALVYLAKHVMIERLSAIKVLRQDLGMNPAHRERFLREARAVNRINHPGIVEITDFGENDGLVFLVMEYVEGESLLKALRQGVFPWQRAARVGLQVASALARAHELGVIHRDLKPENVLLVQRRDDDGTSPASPGRGQNLELVKLTDFGIAKVVDAPKLTFTEQRLGTPGYIPPEYMEGGPATARGDLYSLGVVLYEMLTGKLPFDAKGVDLLVAVMGEPPVPLGRRVEGVPQEIEELVMRLISRNPEERHRDAFVVHDALVDLLRRLGGGPEQAPRDADDGTSPASPGRGRSVVVERESVPTLVDEADADPKVTVESTSEIASGEIVARWHAMIEEVTQDIAKASGRRSGRDVQRARELTEVAKELMASLDRARAKVAEHQADVDRLEERGRSFRATLGHAIDTLSRDLSQENAHLEAIRARRAGIDDAGATRDLDARRKETLFWEEAALATEEKRVGSVAADLSYQLTVLQKQLDLQNEELDRELADATGKLEGALTAMRRMSTEFVRTVEDAAGSLTA
jgi:serine/threonine-protein kinase